MPIPAHILQQAIDLYLPLAYPDGSVPPAVRSRIAAIQALPPQADVPQNLLERDPANCLPSYALRLGQPKYPHMKLVIEPQPEATPLPARLEDRPFLLRVDAHDRHLHAAPGSPDAAWLASVRASNQDLTERIESAWSAAGLPTFKDFLRQQLLARKARNAAPPASSPSESPQ
jgi:hypothetical protein